jgi:hypothetical protein
MSGGTSWDTGTAGTIGIKAQFVQVNVAISIVINSYLDDAQADALRELYKTTLGSGLNLP